MSINKKAGESLLFLFYDTFVTPIVVDDLPAIVFISEIKLIAIHKRIQRIVIMEHCFLA